jgi:hypothetical protein
MVYINLRKMRAVFFLLIFINFIACKNNQGNKEMTPFTNIEDARKYVAESFNDKEETLLISDELNDEMGINMTIILDGILSKGYDVNGFEQKEGYRIYKYKKE